LREPIYGPDQLQLMQSHHQAIVDAVRAGDADAAEAHAREHIQHIRDSVAEALGSEG
jgi:DNA-binding GntR family transcriptional regulator